MALPSSQKPPKKRWLRWTAIAFFTYTVFGFLILPLIVRAVAVRQLSKQLDREVTIRKVRMNPFVLSATIQGLLIKDKDGQPFLSWDEVYSNFQLSSFFGKPWVFKEIHATQPHIRVQINKDYTFNFSDLLKKFASTNSGSTKPGKPLQLEVDQFYIKGAVADVTDLTMATPFHRAIGPLQVTLTGFHTTPDSRNPYSFSGTTDAGERFAWNGFVSLDPLRSAGELSLSGFSITKYSPLFQDLMRFEVRDGVVDFKAKYDVAWQGTNLTASAHETSINLKDFKAADKNATNDLVELDSLSLEGIAGDVTARTGSVAGLVLDGLRLSARRDSAGDLNLMAMGKPSENLTNTPGGVLLLMQAATNAIAALINTTNLWSGTLETLQVTNGSLLWEDQAAPRPVRAYADQIAMTAKNLSNIPGAKQSAAVSLRWNTNGTVRVDGEAEIQPARGSLAIACKDVDLQPIDPYLAPFVNVYIRKSKLDVDGSLRIEIPETNAIPNANFTGSIRLNDFFSVDGFAESDLLQWSSFDISGIDASLNPPSIKVKSVTLTDPVAHVAMDTNQELNVFAVLKLGDTNAGSAAKAAAQSAKTAGPSGGLSRKFGGMLRSVLDSTNSTGSGVPDFSVDVVAISNGVVQFEDHSMRPSVRASVQALNGTISGVSSSNLKRADVSLSGKANRTGPFEITGKINPLSTNVPTELLVKFNEVDLSPASPYSGKFLGYKLDRGLLSLTVNYQINGRKLVASNLLTLDHFTLGEKVTSADATKLPVRLAVALLKDRNGRIQLDVPIDGSLDDPNFHFGKVIGHVIMNIVTKMVTSPFAALGSLFGGKGEEVSYIEFTPGRSELATAEEHKLQALAHGLQERPALQLEMVGAYDPERDTAGLRHEKLETELRRHKWQSLHKSQQARTSMDQIQFSPSERMDALNALFRAMAKTNNALLEPATKSQTPTPVTSEIAPTADHGAILLIQSPREPQRTPDETEQALAATMQVSEAELKALASARARSVFEKLKAGGELPVERLILSAEISTNAATRVFFSLQ